MNKKFVTLSILIFLFFSTQITSQIIMPKLNLMPYPKFLELGKGEFRVNKDFKLNYNLHSERLKKASDRFLQRLANKTGLFLTNPFAKMTNSIEDSTLSLNCKREDQVNLDMDESYTLRVMNNKIELESETDIGALRGLETLLQLLNDDEQGYYFPEIEITDSPRFPWRGLMIDICRHFMPIEVIKRNLNGMAAVKMNVFHWHLSEDQGFRVESKTYPKLHEIGSDGLYYTHEQIKEIVQYADDRGIRVIPEFDVPGHATAILAAFPELASAPGPYEIERDWGVFDPTLNPINDKTYEFLGNLFSEMSTLFPDEYFHIGGDENSGKQWDNNEDIQKFMKENDLEDNHALQGYFNKKLLIILTNLNKKMIGWDEIFHPSMPNNIVIQSWRGKKALIESAQKGYKTILSNGYYIDLMQPAAYHYSNDPLPVDSVLTKEEKSKVLGGEATMWSEMVSHETIDSRIWPRTAAIAERLWSPQQVSDVDNMYGRLESISLQLEEHGLTHIKNTNFLLRRITKGNNIEPLQILMSAIEPVENYNRYRLKPQTQQTPLTRVVDVATADAKEARIFKNNIDKSLSNNNDKNSKIDEIKTQLLLWKKNHSKLKEVIKDSPILFEIEPLSLMLSDISQLGLELIDIISQNKEITSEWKTEKLELLKSAKEPIAQTELVIVSSIEKLLNSIK